MELNVLNCSILGMKSLNLEIKNDKNFEINLDNFYKDEAIKYIKNDPFKFLIKNRDKELIKKFVKLLKIFGLTHKYL